MKEKMQPGNGQELNYAVINPTPPMWLPSVALRPVTMIVPAPQLAFNVQWPFMPQSVWFVPRGSAPATPAVPAPSALAIQQRDRQRHLAMLLSRRQQIIAQFKTLQAMISVNLERLQKHCGEPAELQQLQEATKRQIMEDFRPVAFEIKQINSVLSKEFHRKFNSPWKKVKNIENCCAAIAKESCFLTQFEQDVKKEVTTDAPTDVPADALTTATTDVEAQDGDCEEENEKNDINNSPSYADVVSGKKMFANSTAATTSYELFPRDEWFLGKCVFDNEH